MWAWDSDSGSKVETGHSGGHYQRLGEVAASWSGKSEGEIEGKIELNLLKQWPLLRGRQLEQPLDDLEQEQLEHFPLSLHRQHSAVLFCFFSFTTFSVDAITVSLCLPIYTCVYLCLLAFTCDYKCLLVHVCLSLPMFTRSRLCLHLFTYVYACLLVFTYVYPCLLVSTFVYSCFPMFNTVYMRILT